MLERQVKLILSVYLFVSVSVSFVGRYLAQVIITLRWNFGHALFYVETQFVLPMQSIGEKNKPYFWGEGLGF